MYVSIRSKAEAAHSDSSGKETWVNADFDRDLKLRRTEPAHIGSPKWHVEFAFTQEIERSSGKRGGWTKAVYRSALLQLTPQDIERLLRVLSKAGVLDWVVKGGQKAD